MPELSIILTNVETAAVVASTNAILQAEQALKNAREQQGVILQEVLENHEVGKEFNPVNLDAVTRRLDLNRVVLRPTLLDPEPCNAPIGPHEAP